MDQVEALMAMLAARSVVGLAGAGNGDGGGDEVLPILDKSESWTSQDIFRITAIKNRFS